ncbi:MAG: C1 family peptidase [Candidatus Riflebacteria bacterium]|nr:C1 family peptidase [Candidatus Riflebacteria bacterium]
MKKYISKLVLTLSLVFLLHPLLSQTLPTSHDARNLSIITPVKNQSQYGTCWAFSNIAACETNFLLQAYKAKALNSSLNFTEPDYSERYLAWMAFANPLSETNSTKPYLNMGTEYASIVPNEVYNSGGFDDYASAFLHKGFGPVNESKAPYSLGAGMEGITERIPEAVTVTDSYNSDLTSSEFTHIQGDQKDRIKQILLETGALSVAVYADDSWDGQDSYEFCLKEDEVTNHAVLLVGWDDDYIFQTLTGADAPAGPGAWIIRNSWSSDWGEDGYCYVSYEDQAIESGVGHVIESDPQKYPILDQHNYLIKNYCSEFASADAKGMAASYIAKKSQFLKAVGFHVNEDDSSYEIKILKNSTNPDEGETVFVQSGTFGANGLAKWSGHRTVPLDSYVLLTAGEKYTVITKVTDKDGNVQSSISISGTQENPNFGIFSVEEGCSFLHLPDTNIWKDLSEDDAQAVMRTLNKETDAAEGKDFTVSSLSSNNSNSKIYLGKADEPYESDPFNPERKTLSNMTANITTDSVYAGTIYGEGKVIKAGNALLKLTGATDYTGGTDVNDGKLWIENGTLYGNVSVAAPAELQGNLNIEGKLSNAGKVIPGNSVGKITINGDFVQASTGKLELEVSADKTGDRIEVTGKAEIAGTVTITPTGGYMPSGTAVIRISDFIQAAAGTTFAPTLTLVGNLPSGAISNNYTLSVGSQISNTELTFIVARVAGAYKGMATTEEGKKLGEALDKAAINVTDDAKPIIAALDSLVSPLSIDSLAKQVSGRPFGSLLLASRDRNNMLTNIITEKLLFDEGTAKTEFGDFATPFKLKIKRNSTNSNDGFRSDTDGIIVGTEVRNGSWNTGFHMGFFKDETTISSWAPMTGKTEGKFAGFHGIKDTNENGMFVFAQTRFGLDKTDTERFASIMGLDRNNKASWTEKNSMGELGLGWKNQNGKTCLMPIMALNYSMNTRPSVQEECSNGDGLALRIGEGTYEAVVTKVGFALSRERMNKKNDTKIKTDFSAIWNHDFKERSSTTNYKVLSASLADSWKRSQKDCLDASLSFVAETAKDFSIKTSIQSRFFDKGLNNRNTSIEFEWKY